jgi:hypothetical protein
MKFNSQICTTKEQSERLLALGLKKETADMYWSDHYGYTVPFPIGLKCIGTPAWSLHRLIEIANLPQYWECISGNWYEEVIATIQSKIHIGGLNKEYLEE